MRRTTLTAAALAALAAPAAAAPAPQHGLYAISLHGTQRAEEVSTHLPGPEPRSFDERGTVTSVTDVRFRTLRPARAVLVREGDGIAIRFLEPGHTGLPVTADFAHSGAWAMERSTGITAGGPQWEPIPEPPTPNCSATVGGLGFGLDLDDGRARAHGSSLLDQAGDHPFGGCPYGDHRGALDAAVGPASPKAIMRGPRTELVLEGREDERSASRTLVTERHRETTVRVVIRRTV
ncbi:MAG TPA: hypothetical protein VIL49_17930 [Capillimicrobium sp.]|jgi:hypothetical protein